MTAREVTPDDPTWQPLLERVVSASAAEDPVAPLNEDALLALRHRGLDGARLYVVDDGFALVRDSALDLVVAPRARRRGAGTSLLEAVTGDHDALVAWSHADHPGAAALAAGHGFRRTRGLWVMRRASAPVEVPATPDGIVVRSFSAGDEPALLAANAAAFAAHPEQGDLTIEGLRARMAESWFDPEGLFLAFRADAAAPGDEVLGFHWTKVHPDGAGEVYVVGVTPAAQGLGLGTLLTTRGLAHLAGRDVLLYVESDNTLAVRLYHSLGFEHVRTGVQYTRP